MQTETGTQIRYQSDYRPGWTYLNGQIKPDYLIKAIQAEEKAWYAYNKHVELMIIYEKTGDENEIRTMNSLLEVAKETSSYTQHIYSR